MNIDKFPQVADAIFQMNIWKIYDRKKVGYMCENRNMPMRALQQYTEYQDMRRVILTYSKKLIGENFEWTVNHISNLDNQPCMELMKDLLRQSRENLKLCVAIAVQTYQKLEVQPLVQVFESLGAWDGVFHFLR
mmetsp:Transcript_22402/g.19310  ORF Transcript_22402/g.19310 Transcript_22402/m.19310 type:complete len:134 (-) Transcript_22402:648-1049(-)